MPARGLAGFSDASARIELLQSLREAVGEGWIVAELSGGREPVGLPYLDEVHLVASSEPPPVWPPADGWDPSPYQSRDIKSWLVMEVSLGAFGAREIY